MATVSSRYPGLLSVASVRTAGGDYVWFEGAPRVVFDAEGKPAGWVSLMRNVTQRRALEDVARARIDDYAALDEPERVAAIARVLAPVPGFDATELRTAFGSMPRATHPQWLAAIATLEHARRALVLVPPGA